MELSVISRVKQAFFKLQHSDVARDVLERDRDVLKKLLAITEIRYSAGQAAQQDVFKAQIQLSLLEAKILQLDRDRRLRGAELNSLLNRPPEAPVGRPGEPHVAPLTKTLAEVQAAARQNSPLRMRDQTMTERAELAVNLARKDYYPDYALSGGYYNQGGLPPMFSFRADVKIPVYFRTKQRAALTEQTQLYRGTAHLSGHRAVVELPDRRRLLHGGDLVAADEPVSEDGHSASQAGRRFGAGFLRNGGHGFPFGAEQQRGGVGVRDGLSRANAQLPPGIEPARRSERAGPD